MQRGKFVFWSLFLSLFLLPLVGQANSGHDYYGFIGKWVNTDHYAEDLTKVFITESYDELYVNVLGHCGYDQCKWGRKKLRKIGHNKYKALYQSKHDSKAIIVSLDSYRKLRVKCIVYDDCGIQTDYYSNYFRKPHNNKPPQNNHTCDYGCRQGCQYQSDYRNNNSDRYYKSSKGRRYNGKKRRIVRPNW